MAEEDSSDESQKTEDPTPRKLEEARKRGQVVQSREVSNWAMMVAATMIIGLGGPHLMEQMRDTLRRILEQVQSFPADAYGIEHTMRDLFLNVAGIVALPLLGLFAVGALSGFLQVGPLITTETMKPDISKISLIKGMGRLFSLRSIAEFVKGILKLIIVSAACLMVIYPYFGGVEHFVGQDFGPAMFDLRLMFLKMMMAALAILLVIAVLDYVYQRHDFMVKMRMSKQEIKEEYRQTEGDPMVKAKLRQLREAKARQRMMQAVPEADVVITNPTHYAVALKYDAKEMDAPVMVAKGADLIAEKIREIAKENKIPLVENPLLARALFTSMEIDQIIPPEHYKAVAEVISYVFKLKGRRP
jgi:flagellar biosynthetic protein FlhB